jgi:molybdenum cofactor cytidylyltransferase
VKKIAALILAAGLGSRAKKFKPLAQWRESSYIATVYQALAQTRKLSEILVVSGYQNDLLEKPLKELGARSVYNPDYAMGMQSSIQMGLRSLTPGWESVMVALVDQPQLQTRHYVKLIDESECSDRDLFRPTYQGKSGNPSILGIQYLDEILREPISDRGCAYLFQRYPQNSLGIEMDDDLCLQDYDFPE